MYEISIIGASDSRDTYENVSNYSLTFYEEAKCRLLEITQEGSTCLFYLGINDRVEVEEV